MTDSESRKSRLPRTGTLLLIALALIISGGALMFWLPYHREQTIVAEIERLGGKVDWQLIRPDWIPETADDNWLPFCQRVTQVDLGFTNVADDDLKQLRELSHLRLVAADGTDITDAGIEHLCGPPELRILYLDGTRVTDGGMKLLGERINLWQLSLNKTKISDAGVDHLKGLTDLYFLSLADTQVTQPVLEWVDSHINSRIWARPLPQ